MILVTKLQASVDCWKVRLIGAKVISKMMQLQKKKKKKTNAAEYLGSSGQAVWMLNDC